ncbi:MAG: PD40 domain-containing protein, partial [Anaerolineae bacterium]|nr:PD40 domain-containing protein [Anaerolineae bacterium]
QTIGAERLDRYTSSLQVEQVTSLGDRPLVVIAANHPDNETAYPGEVWMPLQEEFATYSTNSRYIVTDSSAHDIQRYDPDLVIEAIRWVLDEAAPPVTRDLLFGSDLDGDMDIYRLVMETGEWQALTDTAVDEYMPNWSPNGQYIAFDRLIGGAPIVHRINVDGSDERRLVDVSGQNGWMGWSPDGSQIVFYSTREGSAKLFVMDADGGNPHRISDIVPGYEPNWSPDGTQIVFMSHSFGVGDIFVLTLADGHIEQLTDNGSVSDWDPDWSPDGTQIAFTSDLAGHGNNDIYVMDADGSNLRRLTFHDADDEFPAWSPDGTQIAFCSQRDGRDWDIFVVQADGSYLQQITDTPYDEWGVDWQP